MIANYCQGADSLTKLLPASKYAGKFKVKLFNQISNSGHCTADNALLTTVTTNPKIFGKMNSSFPIKVFLTLPLNVSFSKTTYCFFRY